MKLDLYDPKQHGAMRATDLMKLTEEDLLRSEVAHLQAFLFDHAFGPDWRNAAPDCRCGRRMLVARIPYGNSGTTRITFACTDAVPYTYDTGHEWAVTTSPEHYLETDRGECCGDLVDSLEVVG